MQALWTGCPEDYKPPSDLQINDQCFRYHVLEGKLLVIFLEVSFQKSEGTV